MHHYLSGSSISNLVRTVLQHGGVSPRYWIRFALIFATVVARSPFSIGQKILFNRLIKSAPINARPLFILGHWRSGTTYLHELLIAKYNFAYLSYLQATLPWDFLGEERGWRFILKRALPRLRPMDNIALCPDSPAEDGLALANMCANSFYHIFAFPDRAQQIFSHSVFMSECASDSYKTWEHSYFYLLRKLSVGSPEKRLILKDPAHTAHVRLLLELFPDAQFIYLKRDRTDVLQSMQKMCETLTRSWALRAPGDETLTSYLPALYDQIEQRFHQDKKLIPSGNLIEISYNDLVNNPEKCVIEIAQTLHL